MIEKTIYFKDFGSVKRFLEITSKKPYDIELMCKNKTVDAKNADAIFSLDLTKPLVLVAHCESAGELLMQIRNYLYEGR